MHSGDCLEAALMDRVSDEVDAIDLLPHHGGDEEQGLKSFQRCMRDLLGVARDLGKPIAF
jgi:hypothetical protein